MMTHFERVVQKANSVVAKFLLRLRNRFDRKIYPSYEAALQDCTTNGYRDHSLAEIVYEKTKRFKDSLQSHVFSHDYFLERRNRFLIQTLQRLSDTIHVIDYGGGCGQHYFMVRNSFHKTKKLVWCVVETNEMCVWGKKLENCELHFFESFKEAIQALEKVDFMYASGLLQHVPDPYLCLQEMTQSGIHMLLLSRLCFTPGPNELYFVCRTMLSNNCFSGLPPGFMDKEVAYPYVVMTKKRFDEIVNTHYTYVDGFEDRSGIYAVRNLPLHGSTVLYQLKYEGTHFK